MKATRRHTILTLTVTLCLAAMFSFLAMPATAFAEPSTYDGNCWFDGKTLQSDFESGVVADKVTNLEPGDEVTFTVQYTNRSDEETDWYLENEVLQTLEKADQARKTVDGTGTAEGGGYTYELIHVDKNGKKATIFSNSKVGGEAKPADMEGLEQATNATDDWFYIQTLKKDESGTVILHVAFEGETEVNDYMDTNGALRLRFAVEKRGQGGSLVTTGDPANLMPWFIAMGIAGLILLLLALTSLKKDRSEGGEA